MTSHLPHVAASALASVVDPAVLGAGRGRLPRRHPRGRGRSGPLDRDLPGKPPSLDWKHSTSTSTD